MNVLRKKLDALKEENYELRRRNTETYTIEAPEIIVLKTQCDMYKQQYEELLERLLGK